MFKEIQILEKSELGHMRPNTALGAASSDFLGGRVVSTASVLGDSGWVTTPVSPPAPQHSGDNDAYFRVLLREFNKYNTGSA